jgi:hypothetical protein
VGDRPPKVFETLRGLSFFGVGCSCAGVPAYFVALPNIGIWETDIKSYAHKAQMSKGERCGVRLPQCRKASKAGFAGKGGILPRVCMGVFRRLNSVAEINFMGAAYRGLRP